MNTEMIALLLDINECMRSESLCDQLCMNTDGSYYCDCTHGYVLNSSNAMCDSKCALSNVATS